MTLPIVTGSMFPHEMDLNRAVGQLSPSSSENQYQGLMPTKGNFVKIFSENAGRVALFVQNHGMVKLYFAFRESCNNQLGGFHHILVPCADAEYDGFGGSIINSSWRGPCSIYVDGDNPLFTAWEMYI